MNDWTRLTDEKPDPKLYPKVWMVRSDDKEGGGFGNPRLIEARFMRSGVLTEDKVWWCYPEYEPSPPLPVWLGSDQEAAMKAWSEWTEGSTGDDDCEEDAFYGGWKAHEKFLNKQKEGK